MKAVLSFFAVVLASTVLAVAGVKTGEAALDFQLKDINGQQHSLSEYKGKYVVLEWVNHGCPFVKKHYDSGNMPKLQRELTGKGVVWLSICSSAPGKQGNMPAEEWKKVSAQKGSAATAILLDEDGKVGRLYGAKATPHMFLITPEGKLVYQGAIDSIASPDIDDIAKAKNYVRAAYEEASAGKSVTDAETKAYGCGVKYP